MTAVGTRIRQLRTEQKLSMEVLSRRAETSVATISRLERHNTFPAVETLARIARELDTSLSALFENEVAS